MDRIDLGLADVRPLPGVAANPERWNALRTRMHRRIFLRSEGNVIVLEAPQQVSGKLLERSIEVVAAFNRFYAGAAAAYYARPDLRDEFLVNPLLQPLLDIDDQPVATPLSRFDAVLEDSGHIRVIELNSVGVCLIHMRGLLYLVRELARGGFEDDAKRLDELARDMVVQGFLRYINARHVSPPKRPVIGALTPSGFFRAGQLLFRAAFERAGCDYVFGGPEHLEVTDQEIRIRGQRIDALWGDFLFYLAYQQSRYKDIPFPTKMPEFGQTPAQVAELLANRRFLGHLQSRRVVNISPARSFLGLAKSLLSWIHRSDRPVHEPDRAFLAAHVAETWSARDRADGMLALDEVVANRGDYLIKPCQYGASFGVELGRMTEAGPWRDKLVQLWADPSWAVQRYHHPVKTRGGEWVSLGLSNFDGVLGGIYLRTSPSLLINARDSGFVPAVRGGRD